MASILNRITALGLALALLIALALGWRLQSAMDEALGSAESIVHALQVERRLERYGRELRMAQAMVRGHVLFGDERSVALYRESIENLGRLAAELGELTADNPAQQRQLEELKQASGAYFAHLDNIVATRREKGLEAARNAFVGGAGHPKRLETQGLVDAMIATEDRLLAERRARYAQDEIRSRNTIYFSGALVFAILAVIVVALRRDNRRRLAAERRAREVSEGLEYLVDLRTAELKKWETIFRSAGWGVVVADPQSGHILAANPALTALLGAQTPPVGRPLAELFAPEERTALAERTRQAETAGRLHYESVWQREDGTRFPVEIQVAVFSDADGKPYRAANVMDISERRQAARALQEAHDRYRELVLLAADYFWELDEDFRFRELTAAARISGRYNWQAYIGKARWEMPYLNMDAAKWAAHRADLEARRPFRNLELGLTSEQGETRWFLSHGDPLFDRDGRFTGYRGVSIDITAVKRAETALREREEQLRLFVEHAPAAIAMFDRDMRYLVCSRRWIEDYGLGDRDIAGRSHYEIFPEIPQRWRDIHARCLAGATESSDADSFLRQDGSTQWLKWFICPWQMAEDGIGGILIFSEDVTERETLRKRIERVLETISDGFVALDRDWRYTYVNARAGELFGRDPASLIGRHIWTEFPEGVGQPFQLAYERAMRSGQAETIEDHYAPWDRWFENRIHPSAEGLSIFFHEITERKLAERKLAQYTEQLEVLSRRLLKAQEDERRAIARELHDEIGQALTAVKLGLSALRRRCADQEDAALLADGLSVIDRAIAQVRDRSLDLRPPMLDDIGLAGTLEWLVSRLAAKVSLRITADIAPLAERPAPEVESAAFRIVQEALTNVLRHAGAQEATVRLWLEDGLLCLSVKDDGAGFDPQAREAGFGLSGMRERALLLGGEFMLDSSPGRGAEIRARLPLRPQ